MRGPNPASAPPISVLILKSGPYGPLFGIRWFASAYATTAIRWIARD